MTQNTSDQNGQKNTPSANPPNSQKGFSLLNTLDNKKRGLMTSFFVIWEQVDATRTGVNEIVNKKVIDFLVLLIAIDNDL